MSTYGEKVEKYEERVRGLVERGVEPREHDVNKLAYYLGRAKKKGWDHERSTLEKAEDRTHQWKGRIGRTAKELLTDVVKAKLGG